MVAYITYNIQEAHIVAGRLKHEGIAAFVYQQAGAGALGIHIGNLGEVRVLVRPRDYDKALEVLYPEAPDELPEDLDRIIYDDQEDNEDE